MKNFKSFEEWKMQVPDSITKDALWEMVIYRKALFFTDLAWFDCDCLIKHELGKPIAWQLIRSSGSIPANMEEGFGRGFGKDYARFLRIALGSARESRGWYYRARHVLTTEIVNHRITLTEELIAGLVAMAKTQSRK